MNDKELYLLELKINNAKRLKEQILVIKKGLDDLEYLKMYAGDKRLIGYSGKIGDRTPLREVKLNDFYCAKSVIDLMLETGKKHLNELQKEYDQF